MDDRSSCSEGIYGNVFGTMLALALRPLRVSFSQYVLMRCKVDCVAQFHVLCRRTSSFTAFDISRLVLEPYSKLESDEKFYTCLFWSNFAEKMLLLGGM